MNIAQGFMVKSVPNNNLVAINDCELVLMLTNNGA
jgi:hypothetical protein